MSLSWHFIHTPFCLPNSPGLESLRVASMASYRRQAPGVQPRFPVDMLSIGHSPHELSSAGQSLHLPARVLISRFLPRDSGYSGHYTTVVITPYGGHYTVPGGLQGGGSRCWLLTADSWAWPSTCQDKYTRAVGFTGNFTITGFIDFIEMHSSVASLILQPLKDPGCYCSSSSLSWGALGVCRPVGFRSGE